MKKKAIALSVVSIVAGASLIYGFKDRISYSYNKLLNRPVAFKQVISYEPMVSKDSLDLIINEATRKYELNGMFREVKHLIEKKKYTEAKELTDILKKELESNEEAKNLLEELNSYNLDYLVKKEEIINYFKNLENVFKNPFLEENIEWYTKNAFPLEIEKEYHPIFLYDTYSRYVGIFNRDKIPDLDTLTLGVNIIDISEDRASLEITAKGKYLNNGVFEATSPATCKKQDRRWVCTHADNTGGIKSVTKILEDTKIKRQELYNKFIQINNEMLRGLKNKDIKLYKENKRLFNIATKIIFK